MLAARLHRDGLNVEEIEEPSPRPGEALVHVHAAAITRGELEWPVDRLPAITSYELSGVLVDSGDEVYALTPFDRDATGCGATQPSIRTPRTRRSYRVSNQTLFACPP